MFKKLKDTLIGTPLRSSDIKDEQMSTIWGLPILASDAVSSVAYAVEEILRVLFPVLAIASFAYVGYVSLVIIALLLTLIFSYSQIIDHYPNGGGAYTVSRENLGEKPSLLAASSLVIDYILTVSVSIAAATAALTSAFPQLLPEKIVISLVFIALVTLGNLRGVRESSKIFGIPTYLFMFSMIALIVTGLFGIFTGNLHPGVAHETTTNSANNLSSIALILLLMRSFSSGCSALTGVEAVSNSIPNFKEPSQKRAKQVLLLLGLTIIIIFGGTSLLAVYTRVYNEHSGTTLMSQISMLVFGKGFMFYTIQFTTSLILLLAANTSYTGLPLLLSLLAHDHYMPRQFMHRGTKLSFSNGIVFIAVAAAVIIIAFNADTTKMIPLYAVGVFISFTLSQFGMFRKWLREKDKGWQYKSWINGIGSLITFIVIFVMLFTKFHEGAWLLVIVIPTIMLTMYKIHKYYNHVYDSLRLTELEPYYQRQSACNMEPFVILVHNVNKSTLKCINYTNALSCNVTCLHIAENQEQAKHIEEEWDRLQIPVQLEILRAPFRDILNPLKRYLRKKTASLVSGEDVTVVMAQYLPDKWYGHLLHNQTTFMLQYQLRQMERVVTTIIPYKFNVDYKTTKKH